MQSILDIKCSDLEEENLSNSRGLFAIKDHAIWNHKRKSTAKSKARQRKRERRGNPEETVSQKCGRKEWTTPEVHLEQTNDLRLRSDLLENWKFYWKHWIKTMTLKWLVVRTTIAYQFTLLWNKEMILLRLSLPGETKQMTNKIFLEKSQQKHPNFAS